MGANGTMYQCDEGSKDTFTCMATMEASMGKSTKRSPFPIWYTDYENIDMMYTCSEHFGGWFKYQSLSVSSRTSQISDENLDKVKQIIKEKIPEYDLDTSSGLYWTKQNNWCSYDWKFDSDSKQDDDDTKFLL